MPIQAARVSGNGQLLAAEPETGKPRGPAKGKSRQNGRKKSTDLHVAGISQQLVYVVCVLSYFAVLAVVGQILGNSAAKFFEETPLAIHVIVLAAAVAPALLTQCRLQVRKSGDANKRLATWQQYLCGIPLPPQKRNLAEYQTLHVDEALDYVGLAISTVAGMVAVVCWLIVRVGISSGNIGLLIGLGMLGLLGVLGNLVQFAIGAKLTLRLTGYQKPSLVLGKKLSPERAKSMVSAIQRLHKFDVVEHKLHVTVDV